MGSIYFCPLAELPLEIKLQIFRHLVPSALLYLSLTSRFFYRLVRAETAQPILSWLTPIDQRTWLAIQPSPLL
jgi:hypothetical protein